MFPPLSVSILELSLALVTIGAYAVSRTLFVRYRHPLLHPVFLSAGIVILALTTVGFTFDDYRPTEELLTWPLGPVTVALALPVYHQRDRLRRAAMPLACGISVGILVTIATVLGLATLGHVGLAVRQALAIKSVTAPIAVELAKLQGIDPSLATAFVITTGILGAILGPGVLTVCRVTQPMARGIALGTISHGQGTASALLESETAGALASLAMVGSAILTSLIAPLYVPWLLHVLG